MSEAMGSVGGIAPETDLLLFYFAGRGAAAGWGVDPKDPVVPTTPAGKWLLNAAHVATSQAPSVGPKVDGVDFAWSLAGSGGGVGQFSVTGGMSDSTLHQAKESLTEAGFTAEGDRYTHPETGTGPIAPPEVRFKGATMYESTAVDVSGDKGRVSDVGGVKELEPCLTGAHLASISTRGKLAVAVSVKDGATSAWACVVRAGATKAMGEAIVPTTEGVKVSKVSVDGDVIRLDLELPEPTGEVDPAISLVSSMPEQPEPGF